MTWLLKWLLLLAERRLERMRRLRPRPARLDVRPLADEAAAAALAAELEKRRLLNMDELSVLERAPETMTTGGVAAVPVPLVDC